MENKIAYQTNELGIYVGEVYCQPSPLEPGVWLIPGGATDVVPPEIPEGKQAKLVEGSWVVEDIPVPVEVPPQVEEAVEGEVQATVKKAGKKSAKE